jgi:hypothetical protein
MKRSHLLYILLLGALICLVVITQLFISFFPYININTSSQDTHLQQHPQLEKEEDSSANSLTLLSEAATAAGVLSSKKHYDGSEKDNRILELEGQVTKWSALLSSARVDVEEQRKISAKKIKSLEDKLQKLGRIQSHTLKINLLKQLVGTPASESVGLTSGNGVTSRAEKETSSMFMTISGTSAGALPSLKVYVYDMPREFNSDLAEAAPNCMYNAGYTWQTKYTLETYMHKMLLKSSLRTTDPEQANLFYVPIYVGCYLHNIGTNFLKASTKIMDGVKWIKQHHPYWDLSQGRDHVFTFTHDIGGCVAPFRELRNSIFM